MASRSALVGAFIVRAIQTTISTEFENSFYFKIYEVEHCEFEIEALTRPLAYAIIARACRLIAIDRASRAYN